MNPKIQQICLMPINPNNSHPESDFLFFNSDSTRGNQFQEYQAGDSFPKYSHPGEYSNQPHSEIRQQNNSASSDTAPHIGSASLNGWGADGQNSSNLMQRQSRPLQSYDEFMKSRTQTNSYRGGSPFEQNHMQSLDRSPQMEQRQCVSTIPPNGYPHDRYNSFNYEPNYPLPSAQTHQPYLPGMYSYNSGQRGTHQINSLPTYADYMAKSNSRGSQNQFRVQQQHGYSPNTCQRPPRSQQKPIPNTSSVMTAQSQKANITSLGQNSASNKNDGYSPKTQQKKPEYRKLDSVCQNQSHQDSYQFSYSSDQGSDEDEEEMYFRSRSTLAAKKQSNEGGMYNKNKYIQKARKSQGIGTGMDSPEEIKKWVEARKKNYPTLGKQNSPKQQSSTSQFLMSAEQRNSLSQLQLKIRKKISILNSDSRGSILKKIKNIDLLRRIIEHPEKILSDKSKRKQHFEKSQTVIQKSQEASKGQPQETNTTEGSKSLMANPTNEKLESEQEPPVEKAHSRGFQISKIDEQKQDSESDSQCSVEPVEQPVNKKSPGNASANIFEVVKGSEKEGQRAGGNSGGKKKQAEKVGNSQLDPEKIIRHLQEKQEEDRKSMNTLFDYRANSFSYKYRVETLQTNFKLDDIFAETTYLLQAIRYIIKEKDCFFDETDSA